MQAALKLSAVPNAVRRIAGCLRRLLAPRKKTVSSPPLPSSSNARSRKSARVRACRHVGVLFRVRSPRCNVQNPPCTPGSSELRGWGAVGSSRNVIRCSATGRHAGILLPAYVVAKRPKPDGCQHYKGVAKPAVSHRCH